MSQATEENIDLGRWDVQFMYKQRPDSNIECFLLLLFNFVLIQGLSMIMEITDWLDWHGQQALVIQLVLQLPVLVTNPSFYMGS